MKPPPRLWGFRRHTAVPVAWTLEKKPGSNFSDPSILKTSQGNLKNTHRLRSEKWEFPWRLLRSILSYMHAFIHLQWLIHVDWLQQRSLDSVFMSPEISLFAWRESHLTLCLWVRIKVGRVQMFSRVCWITLIIHRYRMFRLQIDFLSLIYLWIDWVCVCLLLQHSALLHFNAVICVHTWERPGLVQLCEMTVMSWIGK